MMVSVVWLSFDLINPSENLLCVGITSYYTGKLPHAMRRGSDDVSATQGDGG